MRRYDQVTSLAFLVLAVYVGYGSVKLGLGTANVPGPGFLPFWGSVFLGTWAVALFVYAILSHDPAYDARPEIWPPRGVRRAWLVMLALLTYAVLLPVLGYLITTFLLMVLLFSAVGRTPTTVGALVVGTLAYALVVIAVTYVVFNVWLMARFPTGIFGF